MSEDFEIPEELLAQIEAVKASKRTKKQDDQVEAEAKSEVAAKQATLAKEIISEISEEPVQEPEPAPEQAPEQTVEEELPEPEPTVWYESRESEPSMFPVAGVRPIRNFTNNRLEYEVAESDIDRFEQNFFVQNGRIVRKKSE